MFVNFFPIILFLNLFFFYVYPFTDINECKGNHSCHVNASCMNTIESHVCQCHAGYTWKGQNCTGEAVSLINWNICDEIYVSNI